MRDTGARVLVAVLAATAMVTGAAPAHAAGCATTQLTTSTGQGVSSPTIDADGSRIAFTALADLNGQNPDRNSEVFVRDTTVGAIQQLTTSTGGYNGFPSIDDSGARIAFESNRNLIGTNHDQGVEVFRVDSSGAITQITSSTSGTSRNPSISGSGRYIAFESTADLTGGNADHSEEIFRHSSLGGGSTTQITNSPTTLFSDNPSVDASGSRIAFTSNFDHTGANPDHNPEIFVKDLTTGTTTQITDTSSGGSSRPAINATGTRIAFASNANPTGGNPEGNTEVYWADVTTGAITQISSAPSFNSVATAADGSGTRITFQSAADLTGGNVDHTFEIFLHDTLAGTTTQLTTNPASSQAPALSKDAQRVAFSSTADITGSNRDHNTEIFLACVPAPVCDGQPVSVDLARGQVPTTGHDVIQGTAGADTVNALAGNDRFCGLGGNDSFTGGTGADRAFGGVGNDDLKGEDGNDWLEGGKGNDTLSGGAGTDTCHGQSGTDSSTACETLTSVP